MPLDGSANHIQLPGAETVVAGEPERLDPELAGLLLALNVHVGGSLQSKLVKKNRYGP